MDIEEHTEGDDSQQEENGEEIENAQETNDADARSQSPTTEKPRKRIKKNKNNCSSH